MNFFPIIFSLLATALPPNQETAPAPEKGAAVAIENTPSPHSALAIDPKNRAHDYVQAFEMLRKEKPTLKISIRTYSGAMLSNVTDLTASENGTLLLTKVLSNQGSKLLIVPVEEILEIAYSP